MEIIGYHSRTFLTSNYQMAELFLKHDSFFPVYILDKILAPNSKVVVVVVLVVVVVVVVSTLGQIGPLAIFHK